MKVYEAISKGLEKDFGANLKRSRCWSFLMVFRKTPSSPRTWYSSSAPVLKARFVSIVG